jgi:hypothetical protein
MKGISGISRAFWLCRMCGKSDRGIKNYRATPLLTLAGRSATAVAATIKDQRAGKAQLADIERQAAVIFSVATDVETNEPNSTRVPCWPLAKPHLGLNSDRCSAAGLIRLRSEFATGSQKPQTKIAPKPFRFADT